MRMEPHLLAVVCILMSSKFFEIDDNLVAIQELQHLMINVGTLYIHQPAIIISGLRENVAF